MNNKTKIIATLGPSSESPEIIEKLIQEGVDLFRLNLKHNTFDWHKETINRAIDVSNKMDKHVGILVDFQGPEIRLETPDEKPIEVVEGDSLYISYEFLAGKKSIKIVPSQVINQIEVEDEVFIADGDLELHVVKKTKDYIETKVMRDYVINHRKSMNVPGKAFDLPLFADRDLAALKRIHELKTDFVALSFVRTADDIFTLKKALKKAHSTAKVIAKIENAKAIENIEEIVEASDAVMVARGDLGIEVPIRELAYWQKKIIDLCRKYRTPVIVATQMLQSMINNYNPTRAEATDVANAVFDGTDAVMLSEETAMGKYPVKAVREMSRIANFCESHGEAKEIQMDLNDLTDVLVSASVKVIKGSIDFPIKAVVVFTQSGSTARILSRYRLRIPIIAITDNEETVQSLHLSYGVSPYLKKFGEDKFMLDNPFFKELMKFEFLDKGNNVLVIHGNNWMRSGATSDISLLTL